MVRPSGRFQPKEILKALKERGVRYVVIGNLGGILHGSPLYTGDVDICPARDPENLARLAQTLEGMCARLRAGPTAPEGLAFPCDAAFLAQKTMWNLVTRFGDFDVSFEPSGTGGYENLSARAVRYDLGQGLVVHVAALEDIIRSKEAANREKDRQALPTLRLLLEKTRELGKERGPGPLPGPDLEGGATAPDPERDWGPSR